MIDPQHIQMAAKFTAEYEETTTKLREALTRQFLLGRELVNLREQLGEANLQAWMELMCPTFPWVDAEMMMDRALDSPLARKLGKMGL